MSEQDEIDDITNLLRQSAIEAKGRRQKEKYCVRDFSGEVFELTPEMLVNDKGFEVQEKNELAGVAECILHKYAKLLSLSK